MLTGIVLELSILPATHPPIGAMLLHAYGPATIYRLCVDPTAQPADTMSRRVEVDWVTSPEATPPVRLQRDIGWTGLQHYREDLCTQLPFTTNSNTVTEWAAIGVMALLIHDLEGAVLQTVLQIGNGGDYLAVLKGGAALQVEVSGIRAAEAAATARARLVHKSAQVLTHGAAGYASVTTFSFPPDATAHSYLRYVMQVPKKKGGKKGKKK